MTGPLTADELRARYLGFFAARGHAIVPGASLVPESDDGVLFTTAGMHPFVPYFLGQEHPAGRRIVDVQRCVRTVDIDEVGDDSHLTSFEMLGNWSFGDDGRHESIGWSHAFLTGPDGLGLDPRRLWVTVFSGNEVSPPDHEAAHRWRELGIVPGHIGYLGEEDNWWAAGPEGPCGPDTEIFVDLTGRSCPDEPDCRPGRCGNGRFLEVWNTVFITWDRRGAEYRLLPRPCVDTGMGLERMLAVLAGASSVWETPVLAPVVDALVARSDRAENTRAVRVLADHLRTSVYVLGDPVPTVPANHGRGHVLRRLVRRSVRFARMLGMHPAEWVAVASVVIEAEPDLVPRAGHIVAELTAEVDRFDATLGRGLRQLDRRLRALAGAGGTVLPGEVAFQLHDTFGFPVELTREIAAESGVGVDVAGYERAVAEHRVRSMPASR